MLQSLLIAKDRSAADLIARTIRQSGQINLEQIHCPAPTPYQLHRSLNTLALDVVFLETTHANQARLLYEEIAKRTSKTAIVGFSVEPTHRKDEVTSHSLAWPLSSAELPITVRRAIREASGPPLRNLFSVIPAKGGVGATTLTVNLACHLAKSFHKNVLVAEADLRSGTIADRLNTKAAQSIGESLACADSCVSLIWARHVSCKYDVDWMVTDRERGRPAPSWCDYRHLLTFASSRYDFAFVDLPGLIDEHASEAAFLSRTVFVVTTPEMLSLRLAHQRIEELEALGVPRARIQVIVNRVQSGDINSAEIGKILDCPVAGTLPNDYPAVNKSILEETFVNDGSKLARSFSSLAGVIAGRSEPALGPATKLSLLGLLSSNRRAPVRA